MTLRFTAQGCKVETTCTIQPNGTYTEKVELSVDPASQLALAVEEGAWQQPTRATEGKRQRVRATRHGFELIEDRR